MIDLKRAKEICSAATPAPWLYHVDKDDLLDHDKNPINNSIENARFIAFARTALPEAIEEIERLQKEIELTQKALDDQCSMNNRNVDAHFEIVESLRKQLDEANAAISSLLDTNHRWQEADEKSGIKMNRLRDKNELLSKRLELAEAVCRAAGEDWQYSNGWSKFTEALLAWREGDEKCKD